MLKYVLRVCASRYNTENYINEVIKACKKYGIDEVMLCEDSVYIAPIAQPLSVHEDLVNYCKKAADMFKANNIECSFYLKSLVGHITSNLFRLPYTKFVGLDGVVSENECCLMDEAFADYAAKVMSLYAECGFTSMMIDDDFRSINHCNGRKGCLCRLHIKRTSEIYGKPLTGEDIALALENKDDENNEIRACYLKANFSAQLAFAEKIERAVHAAHPQIRFGLMCSGVKSDEYQGRDMYALIKAFAGKHKPYLRPPGGPYSDCCATTDYLLGFESKKHYDEYLGGDADYISEVDVFSPRNSYTKSLAYLDLQMKLHALAGYDAISLNIIDHYGSDPELYSEYLELIRKNRTEYERIAAAVKGKRCVGVGMEIKNSYSAAMHEIYSQLLLRLGVPVSYTDEKVNFLSGDCVDKKSDQELKKLLSGVLFLDFSATHKLYERGFGEFTGVKLCDRINEPCFEVFSNAEFYGKYNNLRFPVNTGNVYKKQNVFKVLADRTAILLSNFADADLNIICPATVYFKNSLGGTVVSYASDIDNESWLHKGRRQEIQTVLKKTESQFPITLPDSVNVIPFIFTDGKDTVIYLFNCSFDKKMIVAELQGKQCEITLEPLQIKQI